MLISPYVRTTFFAVDVLSLSRMNSFAATELVLYRYSSSNPYQGSNYGYGGCSAEK